MIVEEFLGAVVSQLQQLERRELLLVVSSYLLRQREITHEFDEQYGEGIEAIFLRSLELARKSSDSSQSVSKEQLTATADEAMEVAPDSDDYPDHTSLYTQNAMASCYYLLRFCLDDDFSDAKTSVEKLLETVDALNVVKSRDEAAAFGYERHVLELILNAHKESVSGREESSSDLQIVALQNPIQR